MTDFINKFKIPTILGLAVIFLGLAGGLFLVLREQTFLSLATPDLTAQNITLTNMTDSSLVISWQTNSASASFITFGQNNPGEQTVLDDRDSSGPTPRSIHYVTLKNLLPQTEYRYKIISGKINSDVFKFQTAKPLTNLTGFTPVIGSVLKDDNTPLGEGIAYLSIPGAINQSALIKSGGSFLIPVSQIQITEGVTAKLIIASDKGTAGLLFNVKANSTPLPPIKLGQNIDLTTPEETPQYDLNGDGKINAADNAAILQNFGKNGKNIKGDVNDDGAVNQKDLDLMAQKITDLGSQ